MTKQEQLDYLRELGRREVAKMTFEQRINRMAAMKGEDRVFATTKTEVEDGNMITEASVVVSIPVSPQEVLETAREDLDSLREEEKNRASEGDALTTDEK